MQSKEEKTNVMRILDQNHILYKTYSYNGGDGSLTGVEIAQMLGQDIKRTFKTLFVVGKSGNYFVFVIPVAKELDLKLAAKASGEKNVQMAKAKDLLPLTGYVHGGCSPIGMKKQYATFVDVSAEEQESILFSAGKRGKQVEMNPRELSKIIPIQFVNLCD